MRCHRLLRNYQGQGYEYLRNRVDKLIAAGADFGATHEYKKYTLLNVSSVDVARVLIEHKLDVNKKDSYFGRSPLHYMHYGRDPALAEVFIAHGADVNALDNEGRTPLLIAVEHLNELHHDDQASSDKIDSAKALVETLLKHKADVNVKNEYGSTPLHLAIREKNKELVEVLIAHRADINAKDNYGDTPLDELWGNKYDNDWVNSLIAKGARSGNATLRLSRLLKQRLIDYTRGNSYNREKFTQKVKSLVLVGADVNKNLEQHLDRNDIKLPYILADVDIKPLHIILDNAEIVELFAEHGADVNAKDNRGRTPLHKVSNAKDAQVLLDHGADVNAKDNEGKTPLHTVSNAEVVEVLLAHNADINAKDNEGKTPLYERNTELTKVLLAHNANINAKDNNGRTPLHTGLNVKTAKVLLDHGADINAKDNHGHTPLQTVASTEAYTDDIITQIKFFIEHGAEVDVKLSKGHSLLAKAVKDYDAAAVELILAKTKVTDKDIFSKMILLTDDLEKKKILLKHGANADFVDEDGNPLLHHHLHHHLHRLLPNYFKERMKSAELLAERVTDVNATGEGGATALHLTAYLNAENVAKVLIAREANVNALDDEGRTPLHLVITQPHGEEPNAEMINLLLANGADLSIKDEHGNTPIDYYQLFDSPKVEAIERIIATSQ